MRKRQDQEVARLVRHKSSVITNNKNVHGCAQPQESVCEDYKVPAQVGWNAIASVQTRESIQVVANTVYHELINNVGLGSRQVIEVVAHIVGIVAQEIRPQE